MTEDTKHQKSGASEELEEKSEQEDRRLSCCSGYLDVTQTEGKELPQLGVDGTDGSG